jgi:tetratricopeptide (TPR) repeat protein
MPYHGIMTEMMRSLKSNKALLNRRHLFKKESSYFESEIEKATTGEPLKFKSASAKELAKFRIEHEARMRDYRYKKVLGLLLSALVVVIVSLVFIQVGNNKVKEEASKGASIVISEEMYPTYIQQAELAKVELRFDEAIIQYEYAIRCSPQSWDAQLRLLNLYIDLCSSQSRYCQAAAALAETLKQKHGTNPNINEAINRWKELGVEG